MPSKFAKFAQGLASGYASAAEKTQEQQAAMARQKSNEVAALARMTKQEKMRLDAEKRKLEAARQAREDHLVSLGANPKEAKVWANVAGIYEDAVKRLTPEETTVHIYKKGSKQGKKGDYVAFEVIKEGQTADSLRAKWPADKYIITRDQPEATPTYGEEVKSRAEQAVLDANLGPGGAFNGGNPPPPTSGGNPPPPTSGGTSGNQPPGSMTQSDIEKIKSMSQ